MAYTIWTILNDIRRGEELTRDESAHLTRVIHNRRGYRAIEDKIEWIEKRTDTGLFYCAGSTQWWPGYQLAYMIAESDGEEFSVWYCENSSRYVWAEHIRNDAGWVDRDYAHQRPDDSWITQRLYEYEYGTCDDCGDVTHNDYLYYRDSRGACYCESCDPGEEEEEDEDNDSGAIRNYNTRVDDVLPMRLTPGVRYFGIELEQEFPNDRPDEECAWAFDTYPDLADLCIWKGDGSLSNGAELVSLPKTLDYWQGANPVRDLCEDTYWRRVARSHKTTTCGLHVHVSRNTIPEPVIAKMVVLFNDPSMAETLSLVARRAPNTSYCMASKKSWLSDYNGPWINARYQWQNCDADKPNPLDYVRPIRSICKKQATQGSRYTPVNLTEHTIEFRIFRGTLHWPTIIASIEFCDASISFCQQFGASSMNAKAFNDFLRASITRKTYPALRDYLELRTLLPKRKPRPVTADISTECREVLEAIAV